MGLWHRLFQLAKMDWVLSRSIFDMLSINYNGFGLSKRGIVLWQAVSIALIWVVWRERNVRIFEDKARNLEYLWDSIYFLASLWAFCSKVFKGTPLNVLQLDCLVFFGGRISHPSLGMSVRGRASYKLATKLKAIKQKLKQVDFWTKWKSERSLIEEEFSRKKEAKEDYAKWVKLEEIHWRQLSRELWLREGDRNTGAGWLHGGLLTILLGVCEGGGSGDVQGFHEQNAFLKSLNTMFLVLIPKKGGAEELGDFRPISLVGGLYKLLAKVLANRIKNVIGRVVSSDQNAFDMDRASARRPSIPYLFIMGMEVLSALIRRAMERGCISGCRIRRGRGQALNISHLLFADDAIVFCEAKKDDMTFLSWTLCWFEAALGLRINLSKSEIILVGEVEEILEMAVELGCKVGQLPSTYLGLPLGAPNKAVCVWDGVEERMRVEIGLSGSGNTSPRVWRFARAKEEMWKRVLVAKYGQEEFGWRTKKVNGAFGVGVWKEIMKEADWCWDNMNFKLARRFPQLFNVAAQRSATVGDIWDQNSGQGSWNLRFIRGFNDWELNMVDELLQILRSQSITLEEDLALWKGGKNGKFDVKEAYGLLISHSTPLFPKKGIWVENVPYKLAFFAWEATWGRVLTLDRLQKRVASVLWGIVLSLFGAQWVFPETVKEAVISWKGSFVDNLELVNSFEGVHCVNRSWSPLIISSFIVMRSKELMLMIILPSNWRYDFDIANCTCTFYDKILAWLKVIMMKKLRMQLIMKTLMSSMKDQKFKLPLRRIILLSKKEYFSADVSVASLDHSASVFDDDNYDEDEEFEKEHEVVDNNSEVQAISSGEQGEHLSVVSEGEKSPDDDLFPGLLEPENLTGDLEDIPEEGV
ncbi:hypothetical protein CK203_015227 [Vitis vinifera]|uniref:Reverse transcriptase zinc-binding domain-containing protein n=1 Tax=Vitis vinifera TaxID=29760 RepID=A0A438JKF7_VITVI|nr:hypothetical protein CK203_015227 [Vitis vinifera]